MPGVAPRAGCDQGPHRRHCREVSVLAKSLLVNVAASEGEQRRRVGHASTSVEMVGPMPAHAEQRRVLANDCLGVAASECVIYFDFRARRHLFEVFAAMARARLDGVPPDVCIVGQKEQPGATSSPGATAAAAAAKALQALAGSVAEKNKRLSRQLVSMDCAAAPGALCFNDLREVVAWACSVRRT